MNKRGPSIDPCGTSVVKEEEGETYISKVERFEDGDLTDDCKFGDNLMIKRTSGRSQLCVSDIIWKRSNITFFEQF